MDLSEVRPGSKIRIGERIYIVLFHGTTSTGILTESPVTAMRFGDDNDFRTSEVRRYLNTTFCEELAYVVGGENINVFQISLETDDGTDKDVFCRDHITLLTTDMYRRFRHLIPPIRDCWWWLATPKSKAEGWSRSVCYVCEGGVLLWDDSGCSNDVRPFCNLNSSFSNFQVVS